MAPVFLLFDKYWGMLPLNQVSSLDIELFYLGSFLSDSYGVTIHSYGVTIHSYEATIHLYGG
ncbi:MAG: hypothetical protein K0S47_9 [Herbinix sp.]|jgi:hypothetical protein|nr:hypothetical protein [Herbinix sp.]